MMTCDICLSEEPALVELSDQYQTADIKHVCGKCERVLQKINWRMVSTYLKFTDPWLKRVMNHKRKKALAKRNGPTKPKPADCQECGDSRKSWIASTTDKALLAAGTYTTERVDCPNCKSKKAS